MSSSDEMDGIIPSNTLWRDECEKVFKTLKVFFLNDPPSDCNWTFRGKVLEVPAVMRLVHEAWVEGMRGVKHGRDVPKFEQELDVENVQYTTIRVRFEGRP